MVEGVLRCSKLFDLHQMLAESLGESQDPDFYPENKI